MSKRLQVVVGESELRAYRRAARRAGMTVSEWVRQTLRRAERETDVGDVKRKLETIRRAVAHNHPTGDIEQINAEIEKGYREDHP
jgi:GH15 family glucan-1,4-alpha-glucosidase